MKTVILLAFLLAFSMAASFDDVKALVRNDQCAMDGLEAIKPQIQRQIEKLKKNPDNLIAKAELLMSVQKAKNVFNDCQISEKVEPVLGDAVKAAGVGFLLASNCFKDLGAVLLITDEVIQDPSDVANDVVILIFVALLGRQSYADCEQFINFVL